jgi:hypothetical protein
MITIANNNNLLYYAFMQITHVPIRRVSENRAEKVVALFAVFALGVTLGSAAILYQSGKLRAPEVDPKSLAGAIALSDVNTTTTTPPTPENTVVEPEVNQNAATQLSQEITREAGAARAAKQTRSELTLEINDRTIAIDRLNQEIERVKNASVALVTAFDQNCGNWTDTCAKPYTDKLDESNSSYNELVAKRALMTQALADLKQELATLVN